MAVRDLVHKHGWQLALGCDALLFILAVGLWMTGRRPIAVLAWLIALVVPLSVVAVLLDGQ